MAKNFDVRKVIPPLRLNDLAQYHLNPDFNNSIPDSIIQTCRIAYPK
jgi:hypothetical protein